MPPSAFAQDPFAADLAVAPQVESVVTFVLKDEANIEGDRILFSDVAECQGIRTICDETYGVMLGEAPAPGRQQVLSAVKVTQLMEAEWPEVKFTLTGAKFIRVQSLLQDIKDDAVEAALRLELAARFSKAEPEPGDFRISVERILSRGSHKLRPGEFKILFPDLTPELFANAATAKRFFSVRQRRLQVEFHQDKNFLRETLNVEFGIEEYLPVAVNDLVRGEIAGLNDFRLGWVETNRDAGSFVSSARSISGRRLKHAIVANHPVEPSQLEIPLVVKKGQMALMSINRGEMVIQGQVKLLDKGSYGQIVDAQYLKTKKKVRVKIIDSENVQLVL